MALKRKRSSATVSSPASISSSATKSASPPPLFFQQNPPIELSHEPTWSFPTYDDHPQQHLNSRTRKRYRNNRPDEEAVYASTIEKLFAAQKQLTITSPVYSPPTTTTPPSESTESTELPPQRTTLHSFWRLQQAPLSSSSTMMDCAYDTNTSRETSCENDDSMDIDDGFVNEGTSCQSCHRRVHGRYTAIGNLRVCLTCASSAYR
ncbi:uncharacterized protein RCC_06329 [Ramularia collo-cygni]|uniref:Uncharacterized protein n=1 Tax=Ramularia collo-cygni TaxID=112498 RepID=A0A2D3VF97_9PEZI|nr:uncharacterized protein RCC_06329 [Ramularia collo-cygni]CZT20469.1 uncharacterized protein RCC_06329 [Ramularia collo-cygni]